MRHHRAGPDGRRRATYRGAPPVTLSPQPQPVSIVGPDNCPWHYRDPDERVEVRDEHNRYRGTASVESLCDGWHLHAFISRSIAEVFDRGIRQCHEFLNDRGPDPDLPPSPVQAAVQASLFCEER